MKLTYCLWAILLPLLLRAQTKKISITGIVRNAETGKPLPGAVLHVHRANITLTSNELGRFIFSIEQFPDTVNISMVGYRIASVPVTTANPMNILLEETSRSLDSVLVSTGYQ